MKHLPTVLIELVPHKKQRYDTAGDYFLSKNWDGMKVCNIKISKMRSVDSEFMVAVHELVEWFLTNERGISEKEITDFDLAHLDADDPGCLKSAPYRKEHLFSMKIERMICKELGIDFDKYYKEFEKGIIR